MKVSDYAEVVHRLAVSGEPFAVATVVKVDGSTLGKPGFKIVLSKDGQVLGGTLGGVCPESAIVDVGVDVIRTGVPRTMKVYLEDVGSAVEATVSRKNEDEIHVETNCGGMMEVYVEPFLPTERLVIVGQGGKDDVENALVGLAKMLDYEVVVIDHAPVLSTEPDVLIKDADYDVAKFEFQPTDSVVVLTKGERDAPVLEAVLKSKVPVRYLGMLASRKRMAQDTEELKKRGFHNGALERIHSPVGIDLGAVTPGEIAVSIVGEIIAVRHGKTVPHKA